MRHADFQATIDHHKEAAKQEEINMALKINEVAAQAWNETKDKADPPFAQCQFDHQQKLITHAQAVADHGLPSGAGDTAKATDFEKKVAELLKDPDKTEAAIKKSKAADMQAQADAMAAKAKEMAAKAKK